MATTCQELDVPQSPTVLYLSHGGGPMPLLGDPGHQQMVSLLREIAAKIPRPSAILVISAHWEAPAPTATSGPTPPLIYDYYGFPEASYRIQYPCPGEPDLAHAIVAALAGLQPGAQTDPGRGFDHGLFVPLKIMYPEADIPCAQLSLVEGLDPALHLDIGRRLGVLDREGLLVIGSGFSFHNLPAFFAAETSETRAMNEAFESWLLETCSSPELDEPQRTARLIHWEQAPSARYCHPREEHLLPLHVCYGLAGRRCSERFELRILGRKSSMYLWAAEA
jgi:aromatic ring-opening dioxygenase catalytic subunit (LigB family)